MQYLARLLTERSGSTYKEISERFWQQMQRTMRDITARRLMAAAAVPALLLLRRSALAVRRKQQFL